MKTEFTPGPWEAVGDDRKYMVMLPRRNSGGLRYAVASATDELHPVAGFFSAFDESVEGEAHANMQLVSAAPDLYAVCREVADHLYEKQDFSRVREMAQRAIEKALGK